MSDQRTANLGIIRLALFMGVLLFAAYAIFQRTTGRIPDADPTLGTLALTRYLCWGLVVLAIIVANVLRGQVENLSGDKLHSRLMIGWALGEAAALAGGVHYFQGGALSTMIIGVVGFAVVLLILRIPAPRPHTN